jgi:ATP adenylyltransferase
MVQSPLLEPGTLWTTIQLRTEHALRCRALQPVPTEIEFVEQDGIRFLVRLLPALARKDESTNKQNRENAASAKDRNPFLPYEKDLFVADISDTHVCLLNKFNVVDYHVLLVTRRFEEQESLLNRADFEALWICMREFESLGFYNAGKIAGASQRHKHLQVVPLPLAASGPRLPIEATLAGTCFQGSLGTAPRLPFVHALARLDIGMQSPWQAAEALFEAYVALLQAVSRRGGAYNLLVTRRWMLLVPRSRECFDSISINALGFAGALLVRNQQQMQVLRIQGPLTILKNVAVPSMA